MALLTVNASTDLSVLNVTYSLTNESLIHIIAYPFISGSNLTDNSFTVLTPEQTSHGATEQAAGVYNITLVPSLFTNEGFAFEGLYIIRIQTSSTSQGGTQVLTNAYVNIMIGTTIDCCIAEKMITAIDCNCDDDKCNESLLDAQKMFLLKQSAEYVLTSIGQSEPLNSIKRLAILNDAHNKYKKATELCTSGCGCNNSPS